MKLEKPGAPKIAKENQPQKKGFERPWGEKKKA